MDWIASAILPLRRELGLVVSRGMSIDSDTIAFGWLLGISGDLEASFCAACGTLMRQLKMPSPSRRLFEMKSVR
jgi:hypothetical protein